MHRYAVPEKASEEKMAATSGSVNVACMYVCQPIKTVKLQPSTRETLSEATQTKVQDNVNLAKLRLPLLVLPPLEFRLKSKPVMCNFSA